MRKQADRRWLWIVHGSLIVATAAWFAVGFLPFVPLEGDDLALAAGARFLAQGGDPAHAIIYRYDPQAGTYRTVAYLTVWANCDPSVALGLLTAVGGLLLWWTSAQFARQAGRLPVAFMLWIPLLIQELWVASYFGNSTMPAAGAAGAAIVLLSEKCGVNWQKNPSGDSLLIRATRCGRLFGGAILLAFATWLRFDAVLVLPAALWIMLTTVGGRAIHAVNFVIGYSGVLLSLLWVSGARLETIFVQGISHAVGFAQFKQSVKSWVVWGSLPLVIFLMLGVFRLIREKMWRELGLIATGILPSIIVYGWNLTTPKYLLYTSPFVSRLAVHGTVMLIGLWCAPGRGRKLTVGVLVGVGLVQLVGGPLTAATWITGKNWVIAGTHDGPRQLEGLLWNPLVWHRMKSQMNGVLPHARMVFREHLDRSVDVVVLVDDWFSRSWVVNELLSAEWWPIDHRRHFPGIAVPNHADYFAFAPAEAVPGEGRHKKAASPTCSRVALFEVEWLENLPQPPPQWRATWEEWLRDASQPVLWISGRRSEAPQVALALAHLPNMGLSRVTPAFVGRSRPWIFILSR